MNTNNDAQSVIANEDPWPEPRLDIQSMAFSDAAIARLASPNFWHLGVAHRGGSNFTGAWQSGLADGVRISVVDEGVNFRHADLQYAYDTTSDFDPRDAGESVARPDNTNENHGTRVAGVIAGNIENDIGTVGGAQGAIISASYIRYGANFRLTELDEIIAYQQNFDVSNNSWGFTQAFADNFKSASFAAVATALETAVANGRDGLGTVFVFAAGNSKIETADGNIGDDSNFHNLQNSRFVIAVGAHDIDGAITYFSSPGTNVLLTAPGYNVRTTDGLTDGANASITVSGTSFAAPIVSSAVALMLGQNPNLGYRDVQEILALSATSRLDGNSHENGFGGFNGGGLMFDREGGFGRLDAGAAVALARNWTQTSTLANEQELTFSFAPPTTPDPNHTVLQADLVNTGGTGFSIDRVTVNLMVSDSNLKDLRLNLISPDGTRAQLIENLSIVGNQTYLNFTFSSVMTWGEDPYGTWRLELSHPNGTSNFSIYEATVHVYGDADTSDDTYYYTSSFADLLVLNASRAHLTDSDGGNDTLNFAAGGSSVRLDLSRATQSTFQDRTIYLDGSFENAIGSEQNDSLCGSSVANRIIGDYGDDLLFGLGGDDTLIGGAGNDTLLGGSGADRIEGGAGNDICYFDSAWANYVITYNQSSASYQIALGSVVEIVTGVERFVFGGFVADVRQGWDAIVTTAAPTFQAVTSAANNGQASITARSGAAAGTVVAAIVAIDANLDAGDRLTFALVDDEGGPYTGPFAIVQTGRATANIVVGSGEFRPTAGTTLDCHIRITDLAGHEAVEAIAVDILEVNAAPVAQNQTIVVELARLARALDVSAPVDPDGDTVTVVVTDLPTGGTLSLNGQTLAEGQSFAATDLASMVYAAPIADRGTGVDVYTAHFSYSDGANASQSFTISFNITDPINNFLNGTTAADNLDGAAGNDTLNGLAGRDTLTGNIGNDRLDGGGNVDTLAGGKGDDTYFVDHALDEVLEAAREGNDTIVASASYELKAGVAVEIVRAGSPGNTAVIKLTGNEFANTLQGNAAANRLDGGGAADVMQGFRGDDTYILDHRFDHVIEATGAGLDTIVTDFSYKLEAGCAVEIIRTSDFADTSAINLTGNQLANTLQGNAGANWLDGGGAADVMQGFRGGDTYFVDHHLDAVLEFNGAGQDTVITSVSYKLAATSSVEFVRTANPAGTSAINLTGNAFANTLQGNAAANRLDGGDGADVMKGLWGNDTYFVDHRLDTVLETARGGQDIIFTSMSYALAAGSAVELLRTENPGSTAAFRLAGNEFANTIQGNAGANVIAGGAGRDTLYGLGGKDIFVFDTALGRTNIDKIADFSVANDTIYLDDGVFTALAPGRLGADAFNVSSAAESPDSHIIYNSATGALFYDVNGSAAGGAIQFATLAKHLALTGADFCVI